MLIGTCRSTVGLCTLIVFKKRHKKEECRTCQGMQSSLFLYTTSLLGFSNLNLLNKFKDVGYVNGVRERRRFGRESSVNTEFILKMLRGMTSWEHKHAGINFSLCEVKFINNLECLHIRFGRNDNIIKYMHTN